MMEEICIADYHGLKSWYQAVIFSSNTVNFGSQYRPYRPHSTTIIELILYWVP